MSLSHKKGDGLLIGMGSGQRLEVLSGKGEEPRSISGILRTPGLNNRGKSTALTEDFGGASGGTVEE